LRKWNTEISRFIAFCNERQYHEEDVRYLQPGDRLGSRPHTDFLIWTAAIELTGERA